MSSAAPSAIERFFTRRDFWSGAALRSAFCYAFGAGLIAVQMLNLFLIFDLLHHAGEVEVSTTNIEAFSDIISPEMSLAEEPGFIALTESGEVPEDGDDESSAANADGAEGAGRDTEESDGENTASGTILETQSFQYENQGILPAVSWAQRTIWGRPLTALYRNVPALQSNQSAFLTLVLSVVVVGGLRSLAMTRGSRLSAAVGLEVGTRLRQSIHRQRLRLGPSDVDDATAAGVVDLFKTQVDRIVHGLDQWLRRRVHDPLVIALLVLVCVSLHWRVALQCLIPAAFCWYLVYRLERRKRQTALLITDRAEHDLKLLSESLLKTRLVRGFAMEDFEQEQFELHSRHFKESMRKLLREGNWTERLERLAIVGCVSIVLLLLGIKVLIDADEQASLSLAAMIAMVSAIAAMLFPLRRYAALPGIRDDVNQAADRIGRYMQQIPEVGQAVGAKFLEPLSRSLQFENVHYSMPSNAVLLQGLDLKVGAREVIALVSLDPIEARAVGYMLPRFIEPKKGRVLIDGEDVAWVTLESLRAETIYVGGADPFFTGTVYENILCGQSSYSQQDATEAAKASHAHNFILRLQEGYDTVLGEHGEQLSPGESFRLGLARAALRNPALLVIEEPSEKLDDDTKSLVDDAYSRLFPGRTVVLLPSRLSTLKRADRIVVLHGGKVAAIGKHSELVKSNELYRHWEYVNFNEFVRAMAAQ